MAGQECAQLARHLYVVGGAFFQQMPRTRHHRVPHAYQHWAAAEQLMTVEITQKLRRHRAFDDQRRQQRDLRKPER